MADKDATVYIVDVGRSMGKKRNGREESDLDWAMRYVWDKITTAVATGRKTLFVGVIGLRTDGTNNEQGTEEAFEHISVLQPLSQILMPNLRSLRENLHPGQTDKGDAISALVVAIQMITTHCRKNKFKKKIVLVTNGEGAMDTEDVAEITKKIKEDGIELIVLGADFDDAEFGIKEEDKDPAKARNEAILRGLAGDCDGVFGTLQQAVAELGIPRIKPVRPVPSYRGQLTLGDPQTYDSALAIDVERYLRTSIAKPQSASQFVMKSDAINGGDSEQSSYTISAEDQKEPIGSGLIPVKYTRMYQVDDDNVEGGKREVQREELAKGYEYGRTAVHISESDENVTRLETKASFDIIGFVQKSLYERYMNMSVSCVIIAQKTNTKAKMALSSLVHALFELESYAVARLVMKDDKVPLLLLLAPSIEVDYECLVDVQLPFSEDMRKILREHRNLPTDKLMSVMSQYVDNMDLSTAGRDDEGEPAEYMQMDETFSPVLHRTDQATRWRAVHPLEPVPPPYEILTRFSQPPPHLLTDAKSSLAKLIELADVKKVPPKQKGRKRSRGLVKPLSGLNVEELLGREKRTKISPENAIPEFKQMLATTGDLGAIQDASKQMSEVIATQIKHSLGDSGYGRAIEGLRVMREELIALEEPGIYNDFIKDLKQKLLAGDLGGDRREMWWEIRRNQLGFITKKASNLSEVTDEESRQFLLAK